MASFDRFLTEGSPIRCRLQLSDGSTDKFPQAILRDATGAALSGSPVSLTHTGNGLYSDSSINMPSTPQVDATYIVYTDAGHTTESTSLGRAMDTFLLQTATKSDALIGTIQDSTSTPLTATIDDTNETLKGVVEDET